MAKKNSERNTLDSILKELKERKEWAENGLMVYSDDASMRTDYQARIDEIENCIWVIRTNIAKNY